MSNTRIKNLIIFFIPPDKDINGGIMSIFSLAAETRQLKMNSDTAVAICVYPGNKSYGANDLFKNNELIFDFDSIEIKYPVLTNLLLHIPEYSTPQVLMALDGCKEYLEAVKNVHINILNQNIRVMPSPIVVAGCYAFAETVTQSTAHLRYSTQYQSDAYALPTHHMSVFIDKKQYNPTSFNKKSKIILYSPDPHPLKNKILGVISQGMADYELREIKGISYDEYKSAISEAMFVLTFGEGLDAYFIEPIYSETVSFTVYNSDFFPGEDFNDLATVYATYEDLYENIVHDMKIIELVKNYSILIMEAEAVLKRYYNRDIYLQKISRFYQGKYDYTPSMASYKTMLKDVVEFYHTQMIKNKEEKDRAITDLNSHSEEVLYTKNKLKELEDELKVLGDMKASLSWRITRPLRVINSFIAGNETKN